MRFGSIVPDWYIFFCVTRDWFLQHSALRIVVQLMPGLQAKFRACAPRLSRQIFALTKRSASTAHVLDGKLPVARRVTRGSVRNAAWSEKRATPNFAWSPFAATAGAADTRLGRQTFALTKRSTNPLPLMHIKLAAQPAMIGMVIPQGTGTTNLVFSPRVESSIRSRTAEAFARIRSIDLVPPATRTAMAVPFAADFAVNGKVRPYGPACPTHLLQKI